MDIIESSAEVAFPFNAASTVYFAGPSRCGKSTLIEKILRNRDGMFDVKINKVLFCYGVWGQYLKKMQDYDIQLYDGLPTLEEIMTFGDSGHHNLLILDDLISEMSQNTWVQDLFTRISHHKNLSIFWVSQALFNHGKHMRNIALNCTHIILFKNPRDGLQIGTLGRQIGCSRLLQDAYKHATGNPHGYILIDLTQACDAKYRIRSNILPGELMTIYA